MAMRLPRPISTSVDTIAREAVGKDWSLYATLIKHWADIVGQDYAQSTSPDKITFPKGKKAGDQWASKNQTGGTLTISLPQGLTMEFSFLTDQIKERINGFFGYPAIEKVVFAPYYTKPEDETAEKPKKQLSQAERADLEKSLKGIENKELREALEALGESVLRES